MASKPSTTKSREQLLAQRANEFAKTGSRPSFGAPVSAAQIKTTSSALKTLRKNKSLPQFLHFKSTDAAKRALAPVAKGDKTSASLPAEYKTAVKKLDTKLNTIHAATGTVNKMWPRKYAIILHALLSEQPTRKRAPKPKPQPEPPVTAVAAE